MIRGLSSEPFAEVWFALDTRPNMKITFRLDDWLALAKIVTTIPELRLEAFSRGKIKKLTPEDREELAFARGLGESAHSAMVAAAGAGWTKMGPVAGGSR